MYLATKVVTRTLWLDDDTLIDQQPIGSVSCDAAMSTFNHFYLIIDLSKTFVTEI